MKQRGFVLFSLVLAFAASLVFSAALPQKAHALSGSDFKAGRIIDDSVFFDGNSMDIPTIQSFLNSKVLNCDTNGTQPTTRWNSAANRYYTRAEWGALNGNSAPYTCLKDYYTDVWGTSADQYCDAINYGRKSAAGIISDVARACRINPKVLIVLLQKEQSLITDDWPWAIQYSAATGYGCPDTASCDPAYAGLFNQVYYGARQYQVYAKKPQLFNYTGQKTYAIPNKFARTDCGAPNVYVENQATAGLYNYTPYQPNAAALNNLYGIGDDCSSYGNRNFWRMYSDWFGSSYGPAFYASYVSQSSYPIIDSGMGVSVFFRFKNSGTAFWKDDASVFPGYLPVHMATTFPINRWSNFRSNDWLRGDRPTGFFTKVYEVDNATLAADQHTVQPGQIAQFEFTIYANPSIPGGVYREYFQPILEGAPNPLWNMSGWAYLDIGVNVPKYKAAFAGQSAYPTINKGSSAASFLKFKNVGTDPWFDDTSKPTGKRSVHLATSWPINRPSAFGSAWTLPNRPNLTFSKVYEADGTTLAANQHIVQPGQIAHYDFTFTVPANTASGTYKEYFEPIIEGSPGYSWNMGTTAWLGVTVP